MANEYYKLNKTAEEVEEALSGGGDGGSMILLVDGGTISNGYSVNALYYTDGTQLTGSTMDPFLNTLASGAPVYLHDDGKPALRVGEVLTGGYQETSEGYKLCVGGVAMGLSAAKLHPFWYTVD